jgi:exopolysaccharide biosynthesis WecB/TagA/CpsF family protein
VGLALPYRSTDIVADSVSVSLLADRPISRWEAVLQALEDLMPRWITTVAVLPFVAMTALDGRRAAVTERAQPRAEPLRLEFDDCDVARFVEQAAGFGQQAYGYAVTPNTDHVIRLHDDAAFRAYYAAASTVVLDSQFLAHLIRFTTGLRLPVCTGSDLTARLFAEVIEPDDALVLIGGSDRQAQWLRQRYGLRRLAHFKPPMGFIHDPVAVEACLQFIEAHSPFRFCLLAVGAPQQEAVAHRLKVRGIARGLALCIGASINFLTGDERRAPRWMQRAGIEWLYRLLQAPGRLAGRYLVRGPRVFALLRHTRIVLRSTASPSALPAEQ